LNILITWVINFFLGIIGSMFIVSQILSGKSVSTSSGKVNVGFQLDTFGLIAWVVVILVYFVGAKKIWGKTVGGILADKIGGKK
jgi:hypothetical protein